MCSHTLVKQCTCLPSPWQDIRVGLCDHVWIMWPGLGKCDHCCDVGRTWYNQPTQNWECIRKEGRESMGPVIRKPSDLGKVGVNSRWKGARSSSFGEFEPYSLGPLFGFLLWSFLILLGTGRRHLPNSQWNFKWYRGFGTWLLLMLQAVHWRRKTRVVA